MSLKNLLLFAIKQQGEIGLEEVERIAEGYKLSNAERRLRELSNEGLIQPIMAEAKSGTRFISAYRSI